MDRSTFSGRAEIFLGWLKKPFTAKPGFFVHDLILVILATKEFYNLYFRIISLVYKISNPNIFSQNSYRQHLAKTNLTIYFMWFVIQVIIIFQLFKFLHKTKFSWIAFNTLAWVTIINSISFLTLGFIEQQYIQGSNYYSSSLPTAFNFSYVLREIPWLCYSFFVIYLLTRKKIRAMHKINSRIPKLSPLYAIAWIILTQGTFAIITLSATEQFHR